MSSVSKCTGKLPGQQMIVVHSPLLEQRIQKLFSEKLKGPSVQESKNLILQLADIKTLNQSITLIEKTGFRLNKYIITELLKKDACVNTHFMLFNSIPYQFLSVEHYNNLIYFMGRVKDFKLAKLTFDSALRNRMVDSTTYAHFIYACGECKQFEQACSTFELVRHERNERVFNYYFFACGKNNQIDALLMAFGELKEKKTATSYQRVIDALVDNNRIDLAYAFFKESGIGLKTCFNDQREFCIDFHDSCHGVAILMAKNLLPLMPITFITGKGSHGINQPFYLRNKVIEFITDHYDDVVKIDLDPVNEGRLKFTRKTADKKKVKFFQFYSNGQSMVKFYSLSLESAIDYLNTHIHATPFVIVLHKSICKNAAAPFFQKALVQYLLTFHKDLCFIPLHKEKLGYLPICVKKLSP